MKYAIVTLIIVCWNLNANAQNVGIGTTTPSEKLDLNGNMKVSGEIKPGGVAGQTGQILTSNGNGTMAWSMPAGNTEEGNGGWGDCSIYNIGGFQPVGNSNASNGDNFGDAVAIDGEYAIIGSPGDGDVATSSGSATIYKFNATTDEWENYLKLYNPGAGNNDGFGRAVAIDGDYAIVGAPNDTESGQTFAGSATVFKRNTTTQLWESQGKLLNAAPVASDHFGYDVDISGNYAIVGSPYDDENNVTNCGSVTIFKRNTTTGVWESQGKFLNTGPASDDLFGATVSISGNYAMVGARTDDEGLVDVGSVSVYKRNTTTGVWALQVKWTEDIASSLRFGADVELEGEHAIVSAIGYDNDAGSAFIYKLYPSSDIWELQTTLTNPLPESGDQFGQYVSISGDYAAVGTANDDEDGEFNKGSVTIFKRLTDALWIEHQKFSIPIRSSYNSWFSRIALTSMENRFVSAAPGFSGGKGLVIFGQIK